MDNKFCGYCRYYRHEKNGRYTCRNKKSGVFNANPAPFQGCSCFLKKNKHAAAGMVGK